MVPHPHQVLQLGAFRRQLASITEFKYTMVLVEYGPNASEKFIGTAFASSAMSSILRAT